MLNNNIINYLAKYSLKLLEYHIYTCKIKFVSNDSSNE